MSTVEMHHAAARDWAQALAPYCLASAARGLFELAVTVLPFVALWAAMLIAARDGQVWISFAMVPLAAGLLVRLFMIQHDCGHGSFLPSKAANEWIGRAIGVVTMTPYDHWRRCHAIHHATSGNLDRRGIGDIETLTVREYFACDWRGRIGYRLYRHPLVMFGIGPAYLFLIANRLPFGFMRKGAMPWVSTMTTNAGILLAAGILIWSVGLAAFLVVALPIIVFAATASVWLFYVQHQFERTTWRAAADWSQPEAACTAVRINACRHRCAGSPPIPACITCITLRAAFLSIGFRRSCGTIPRWARSVGSVCGRASPVSDWRCGTRTRDGSFHFARLPNRAGRAEARSQLRPALKPQSVQQPGDSPANGDPGRRRKRRLRR